MAFKLKNRSELYKVPSGPVTKNYAKSLGFHIADDMTIHTGQVSDYEQEKLEDSKGYDTNIKTPKVHKDGKKNKSVFQKKKSKKKKSKVKGGGTKKVCLPADKVRRMSKAERARVVRAKRSAAKGGKYKRSSKSYVKGARKKGATLRDWFKNENWVQVGNPSKKCGEK